MRFKRRASCKSAMASTTRRSQRTMRASCANDRYARRRPDVSDPWGRRGRSHAALQAGVQAQQIGGIVWISGVIHCRDGASECANFVRPAMSRIQSIARPNFAGRHRALSSSFHISGTAAHCSHCTARRRLSLQCGTNSSRMRYDLSATSPFILQYQTWTALIARQLRGQ